MPTVHYVEARARFECACDYEERMIAKRAGFRWDGAFRVWATKDPAIAANLIEHATEDAKARLADVTPAGVEPEPPERPVLSFEEDSGTFIWWSRIAFKDLAKRAGFRWARERQRWITKDPSAAAIVQEYADAGAQAAIASALAETQESREASRALDSDAKIPAPEGLEYMPFQRGGIAYAMSRTHTLIGDEMGLGKTIQAIGVANATDADSILVICPNSLKLNWERELRRWLVRERSIGIATGKHFPRGAKIVIANYEILKKHAWDLRNREWDLLVIDECHYLKNPRTQRTVYALGGKLGKGRTAEEIGPIPAKRIVALTGTPIPNRPIEAFPILKALAPDVFGDFWGFAKTYCGAVHNGYGWDFTGASNLDALQAKLRGSVMVRRKKAEVLTELPPKVRQVIELPRNGCAAVIAAEEKAWARQEETLCALRAAVEVAKASDDEEEFADAMRRLRDASAAAFEEMARLRHDTAVAKLDYVVEHVQAASEDHKVALFAHHHDVVDRLAQEFGGAAVAVDGRVSPEDRQAAVDRFQQDPECRVFIGTIQAAGVGLTLTAGSHVIFAELDWVPGNVSQAEDRCHRIGQSDSVLVQHLVLEGSLDARMAHTLIAKQRVIDAALDDRESERSGIEAQAAAEASGREQGAALERAERVRTEQRERVIPTIEQPSTQDVRRSKLAAEAEKMTDAQVAAVHEALQIVAAGCDGAQDLDGSGFSKIDVAIGHDLARRGVLTKKQAALGRKVVRKYRRQFPSALLEAMGGKA